MQFSHWPGQWGCFGVIFCGEEKGCTDSCCWQLRHSRANSRTACSQMALMSQTHFPGCWWVYLSQDRCFLAKAGMWCPFFMFKNPQSLSNFCWKLDTEWRIYTPPVPLLSFSLAVILVLECEQNLLQEHCCSLCFAGWPQTCYCRAPVLCGMGPENLGAGPALSWQMGINIPRINLAWPCTVYLSNIWDKILRWSQFSSGPFWVSAAHFRRLCCP